MNDKLKNELKELIISELALEDVSVDDIRDDQPIFNEGLGLDSIDALEPRCCDTEKIWSQTER